MSIPRRSLAHSIGELPVIHWRNKKKTKRRIVVHASVIHIQPRLLNLVPIHLSWAVPDSLANEGLPWSFRRTSAVYPLWCSSIPLPILWCTGPSTVSRWCDDLHFRTFRRFLLVSTPTLSHGLEEMHPSSTQITYQGININHLKNARHDYEGVTTLRS